MKYRKLGNTGLIVSEVALGTMQFGGKMNMGNLGQEDTNKLVKLALERGINFIDTADVYSRGESETLLGNALKGVRQEIVLATKVRLPMSDNFNRSGATRVNILRGVESSLKRLQTDYIDLYQVHGWDSNTPFEETLRTLNDLVRQGKVRYIGCSNLKAWHLAQYLNISERRNWSRLVCMQPIYSALNRSIESEILPYCAEEGLGVIVYNPLAGGMLTGKYRRGQPLPRGARLESSAQYYARYYTEQALDIVEAFVRAAVERGVTPAQLALAWVLGEPRVTCPIVGARNVQQLDDTLGGLAIKLTSEERASIPAVLPGRWVGLDQVYDRDYAVR
jgi:aryl-alcohol dehydrogenase-like predicted oxidoreductase